MPSIGLLAVAYSLRGIRPALNASLPAHTAYFMASAIRMGSFAPAMAVFIRTASAPYSIARAASEAVPTPASTMTGTCTDSMRIFRLYGLRIPRPEPIAPAPSHRHHVRARRRDGLLGLDEVLVFARAHPESGAELDARDRQPIIVHAVCPLHRR